MIRKVNSVPFYFLQVFAIVEHMTNRYREEGIKTISANRSIAFEKL